MHGTRRLMSTLLESLILPRCFWTLIGMFYYFTWMTSEFWRRLSLIWRVMASIHGWSGLWWIHCHLWIAKTHLSRFHLNTLSSICIFFLFNFSWKLSLILQTLFNCATFLTKVFDASSSSIGRFIFSSPSDEFVNNFIDVRNENMLYNWMDKASMSLSKAGRPFRATKEMHLAIIQALIDVCSKTRSYVADLFTSTCMCFSSKNSFTIFASKTFLTIFHLASNIVRAYKSLGHHILALESDMEVFMEVLELLIEVAMFEFDTKHVHNFDIDSLVKKRFRRLLDYE